MLKSLSHVQPFATLGTVAHQVPLPMGFPRQEYWSGLQFPFAGDLPDPGIEPMSPATAGGFFTTEPPRKHSDWVTMSKNIFPKSNVSLKFQRNFRFLTYRMGVVRIGDNI